VHRARAHHDEQPRISAPDHVFDLAAAVQHGVVQVGGERQLVVEQRGAHQRHDRVDALVADPLDLGDGHDCVIPSAGALGCR
jgi:hypothetical protein